MRTETCQICGSPDLASAIDLGHHPLADTFLPPEALKGPETSYPLEVLLCGACGYATLAYVVPPEKRYQETEYSYTAGNSPVSVKHFGGFAADAAARFGLAAGDLAVDIGGNDGTLLKAFEAVAGCAMLNVEPSPNIARLSRERGIETLERFFDAEAADAIAARGGAAVVTATNVFNHASDLKAFCADVARALRVGGVYAFEVPSLAELVRQRAFDTIYLEHVSYFGLKPLLKLLGAHGLGVVHVETLPYMGGSYRVYAKKGAAHAPEAEAEARREEDAGLYRRETYAAFTAAIERFRDDLCEKLYRIRREGGKIAGIGAATKGNTLLNYCRIGTNLLECVTDSSPLKIGKVTPGSHLPIVADADLPKDVTHALLLPWNIAAFLQEKLKHLPVEFIVPAMKD